MVPGSDTPLPQIFLEDIELVGLVSGLRRVAKKEGPDAVTLMSLAGRLRDNGWQVEHNPRTGCAYISREPELVRRLIELENVEFEGGSPDARRATIHEIGLTLGYPECCAAAFAALPVQDDAHVMASLLAGVPDRIELPWQMNFLIPMTGPLFYYPCSFDCSASLALADRYLREIERLRPGSTARMRDIMARPVLSAGRWDFLVFDGIVDDRGMLAFTGSHQPRDYYPVPSPSQAFGRFISEMPPAGYLSTGDGFATVGAVGPDVVDASFDGRNGLSLLIYR